MKIENVCTKRVYMKDGQEKAVWLQVGSFKTMDNGNRFLELNMFPNTPFYIFERKEAGGQPSGGGGNINARGEEVPF